MKKFTKLSAIILSLIMLTINCILFTQDEKPYKLNPIGNEDYQAILQFYQYDKDYPLDFRIIEKIERDNYIREKLCFKVFEIIEEQYEIHFN
ncbi:MAG: hypothetical protein ISS81_04230 [Candidatus Marinimicrobia bacterium]|nr:hypothetical protein [Candidatus Neomarinimicrobiota bacterium]